MVQTVVDYTANIQVEKNDYFNELHTLQCLSYGLYSLAATVWTAEEPRRRHDEENHRNTFCFGNVPGVSRTQTLLFPCLFHWFGVSLCNYARLVGFIAGLSSGKINRDYLSNDTKKHLVRTTCDDYVDSISELKDIVVWRNKVGAHFAVTDPKAKDNLATLDMSVFYPVAFSDGRFRVGALKMTKTVNQKPCNSELPSWSITEVYEKLAPRYWPDCLLTKQTADSI